MTGNERRGLTGRCRRETGSEQVIAACDLVFPEGSAGGRYVAAYRKWLGNPVPLSSPSRKRTPWLSEGLNQSIRVKSIAPGGRESLQSKLFYFSFITLTTIGYGDIVAVHPIVRMLAILESVVGKLFPVILIARLVFLQVQSKQET